MPQVAAAAALLDGLVQVSFAITGLLSRVAATHDLSLTQLRMLAILRDREPTVTELAAHLGLDRSSVSGLVDRAVGRGLVTREASESDGRALRLGLTADGRQLATSLTDEVNGLIRPMIGRLSATDQRRLSRSLGALLG